MMNRDTHERTDVSGQKTVDKRIECEVPKGNWKLMVFYLNTRAVLKIRNPGLVDYLDEDAMNVFLSLSEAKEQHARAENGDGEQRADELAQGLPGVRTVRIDSHGI